ncbi:hypothetical protein GBAR_LOCUS24113, partial [Geodia barretti]
ATIGWTPVTFTAPFSGAEGTGQLLLKLQPEESHRMYFCTRYFLLGTTTTGMLFTTSFLIVHPGPPLYQTNLQTVTCITTCFPQTTNKLNTNSMFIFKCHSL